MQKINLILVISLVVLLSPIYSGISSTQISIDTESKTFENEEMPNVILMIGDGMGAEQIKAASLVEYGEEAGSIMDTSFTHMDHYGTNAIDNSTTDSAASGTAIATGQKTAIGHISISEDKSYWMKTILEYLVNDFGYASGLVTTTQMAHATNAVFASHSDDRNDYGTIFPQMMSKSIDILLGGGLEFSQIGRDGSELHAENNGYETAFDRDELFSKLNSSEKLLGIFGHDEDEPNMPYEIDRDPSLDPSIIEMTESAIGFLDQKDNPFFLMVEGGRIDHAGHLSAYNNETKSDKTIRNVMETIMYEKAIRQAYEYAMNDGNTILIVGADHETGGLEVLDYTNLDNTLPSEENTREENMDIRMTRALQLDVSWLWNAHTDVQIPFYGYGADFSGIQLNHSKDIFWAINQQIGNFPVPTSFIYQPGETTMNVTMDVIDTDRSVSDYQIKVLSGDGEQVVNNYSVTMTSDQFTIEETVAIPEGFAEYSVYVHLIDGDASVNSFDSNNELITMDVVHELPEVQSSTESSTSQTPSSETSSDDDTYFFIMGTFALLLSLTSIRYLHRKE